MAKRRRVVYNWDDSEITTRGRRPSQEEETNDDEMSFVRIAKAAVGVIHDAIQRIGTAIIGPDMSGNARGEGAFDFQASRLNDDGDPDATRVASGAHAICMGNDLIGSGEDSIVFGRLSVATGHGAFALGLSATSGGQYSTAIGVGAYATGIRSLALGYQAMARVNYTITLCGTQIIMRSNTGIDPAEWIWRGASSQAVIFSCDLRLDLVADYAFALPSGSKFFLSECGIVIVYLTALVTQPTIRFGVSGSPAASLAPFLTTDLTAVGATERFLPNNRAAGVTSLSFGVTNAATATTLMGRAYWKGVLVEDEA